MQWASSFKDGGKDVCLLLNSPNKGPSTVGWSQQNKHCWDLLSHLLGRKEERRKDGGVECSNRDMAICHTSPQKSTDNDYNEDEAKKDIWRLFYFQKKSTFYSFESSIIISPLYCSSFVGIISMATLL
jgi:hypothetical protein